jgi:hypothetical protein
MLFAFLVCFSALIFFAVIPGAGAFMVRRRWRHFRRQIMDSLALPVFHPGRSHLGPDTALDCRFFGLLEAVEENDRLWLRDNQSSVALDLRNTTVYMTPIDSQVDLENLFAGSMRSLRWERTGVLQEGMGVFVIGRVRLEAGLPVFMSGAGQHPLVIFFDGDAGTAVTRAIWFGRQRNEYWNDASPISFLTGFVALLSLAFVGFRDPSNQFMAVISAGLALLPFLPLMPPGFLGFFLYRHLWRQGRTLRARRDLNLLRQRVGDLQPEGVTPLVPLPAPRKGPVAWATVPRIRLLEVGGLAIMGLSILVNFYIALRLIIQLLHGS